RCYYIKYINSTGGCIVKKVMGILFILFVFLLVACNGDEKTVTNHESDTVAEKYENKEKEEKQPEALEDEESSKESPEKSSEATEAKYKVAENWSIVPIDDANEEVVLITIDDAPDEHALDMAKTLKDLDVNAIFFVNGHFLETNEEKEDLKEIHEMGFLIGN